MTKTLKVTNPATGELLDTLELANAACLDAMVRKARAAQPAWEETPLYARGDILMRFADELEAANETIATLSAKDMAKPIVQARGENEDGAKLLRAAVERAKHLYGEVLTGNAPGFEKDLVFTRREALGVIACIIPFNFPIELTFQKIAPALIMGNTVLVKAPSANPLAVMALDAVAKKAGFPEGVVQFMVCDRADMVAQVVKNQAVDAISMTGSTPAGQALMRDGADTLKRLYFELGGNDAMIIFDDADIDDAIDEMTTSRLENNGQVCCASKRFIVHKDVYDEVVEKLTARIASVKTGSALDPDAVVTALVSENAAVEVERQLAETVKEGATLHHGGRRDGARIAPAILTNVTPEMAIASDMEVFGPVFPLIPFDTEDDAIRIANNSCFGLSSGLMTADLRRAFRVGGKLKAGAAVVNGSGGYRHLDQPFGGYKMSSIGREGISVSLEEFSHIKAFAVKKAF
ncbi:MAG: aldehyde dehydrogenase family protein [Planctomycetes bacterium]|nr:aldehyde dehydrogenase family protein [Planctomycetota bacterium]